jgi:hypothetical protein
MRHLSDIAEEEVREAKAGWQFWDFLGELQTGHRRHGETGDEDMG